MLTCAILDDATQASTQKKTSGAVFGHSVAALGDVTGDGIPDVAISANNEGVEGKGAVHLLALDENAAIKSAYRFDMDTVLPEQDRLCRSMTHVSNVDGTFTLACGAGASSTGDVWALSFTFGPAYTLQTTDGGSTLTYCAGGSTLSSNWNHGTQVVTGPLTIDECKSSCQELDCEFITVKPEDGRCIVKSGCTISESSEGSTTYKAMAVHPTATEAPDTAEAGETDGDSGVGGGGGGMGGGGDGGDTGMGMGEGTGGMGQSEEDVDNDGSGEEGGEEGGEGGASAAAVFVSSVISVIATIVALF